MCLNLKIQKMSCYKIQMLICRNCNCNEPLGIIKTPCHILLYIFGFFWFQIGWNQSSFFKCSCSTLIAKINLKFLKSSWDLLWDRAFLFHLIKKCEKYWGLKSLSSRKYVHIPTFNIMHILINSNFKMHTELVRKSK